MTGSQLAAVIILTTFLALVVRELAALGMPARRAAMMGAIWAAIIAVLAIIFARMGAAAG